MNEDEIFEVINSLRTCREFEQRNNIKLFTRKYKKVLNNLEKKLERKKEIELKERVDNIEKNIVKIEKKIGQLKTE